jgi:hypothetical protein
VRKSCTVDLAGFSLAITLLVANLIVNVWLLMIVYRRGVRKQLPWFVLYVAWGVLLASIQLTAWIISPRLYIAVYWWMELIAVVLIVGAVRESFLRIFRGFTSEAWFRWSVWSMILAVVIYSAWKAIYLPPAHSNRLILFVVGAEFAFRWGVFGIAVLTAFFSVLVKEPMDTREDAVVTGFGLASVGVLANVISFSLFGKKYLFLTQYAPSVGYFLAVFWWIWVFSRPVTEFGFKELGMGPEDIAKELRRYRELTERMMRKKW